MTDTNLNFGRQYEEKRKAFLEMSEADFCAAFTKRMVSVAGEKFHDGSSIADYAAETAPTYWENEDQRQDGPEECADADMSYWED